MAPRTKHHKCKLCDYETHSPKYLSTHKLKKHRMCSNEFTCVDCKVTFGRGNNLQWHIRNNLCRHKLPISMVNEVRSLSQSKDNQPEESGIVSVPVRRPVQVSSVNYSNQTADATGKYSEEDTCLKVRLQLGKSSEEKTQKDSTATKTADSSDQNTAGMGDFENDFGEMGEQVRPGSRMSARIQKAKISSAAESLDETADEINIENYDLGLQFRPESRMSSKPAQEEEPSCSVIQSEPILRWNTQLAPTIKLERLKTDENAKMIAKWLVKCNVQPELSDPLVIAVEETIEKNLQSSINPSKRFNCSRCAKCFSYKRNLNTHVKLHHENKMKRFKCVLCKKAFCTQHLLNLHKELLHTSIRLFQCSVCNMLFNNKRGILVHKSRFCLKTKTNANKIVRSQPGKSDGPSASGVPNPVGNNDIEMANCSDVKAGCTTVERVVVRKRRTKKAEKYEKKEKNEQEKNSSEDPNAVSNEIPSRISPSKSMKKSASTGKRKRNSPVAFKCMFCKEAFLTKQLMNRHIQHVHSSIGHFQCSVCNMLFDNKRGMRVHKSRFCLKTNANKIFGSQPGKSDGPSASGVPNPVGKNEIEMPNCSDVQAVCTTVET